jgi:Leucine-rich repeat (LRR) protein
MQGDADDNEEGEDREGTDEEGSGGGSFAERASKNIEGDVLDAKFLGARFKSKNDYLERTIKQKTANAELARERQRELKTQVCEVSELNICRLLLELETGGNIRLEDGKRTDVWHSSCVDLVNSRFFPPDFQVHGINGIQVHRVTRIHNRFLRNRFETRIEAMKIKASSKHERADVQEKDGQNKLEYLFYVQPPVLGVGARQHSEALRIAEEGFQTVQQYRALGQHKGAIRLSNSVSMADLPRVGADLYLHGSKKAQKNRSAGVEASPPPSSDFAPFEDFGLSGDEKLPEAVRQAMSEGRAAMARGEYTPTSGILVVVKVFLGTCGKAEAREGGEGGEGEWPEKYPGCTSVVRSKLEDTKQKEWFVFDNALILPEYLLEFEYSSSQRSAPAVVKDTAATLRGELSGVSGSSSQLSEQEVADLSPLVLPLLQFMQQSRLSFDKPDGEDELDEEAVLEATRKRIEGALSMEPQLKPREKNSTDLASSSDLLLSLSDCQSLSAIRSLNLHGSSLQRLPACFSECKNLESLVLSDNGLHKLDGLSGLGSLTFLDLSFNKLKVLDGFRGLSSLLTLTVNNNQIQRCEDVVAIKTYLRSLEVLDMRNNPICSSKSYRATLLVHLRGLSCLRELDQLEVTAEDRAAAASGEINSRITPSRIRAHARGGGLVRIDDLANGRSLARSQAKQAGAGRDDGGGRGKNQPEVAEVQDENDDDDWLGEVVQLELNHQGLRRLSGLTKLGKLRRASFADNELSRIEGLEECALLEELNLEENQISGLTGLESALYLRKLDLGKNRLTRLVNVHHLVHLTQLSLEDNTIDSLNGLQALENLMELYIGNNEVSTLKEVKHLKELPKLIILDLSGNPLCAHEFYRLYSVYYLQKLKVLDGVGVDVNERSLARERYSGKLTFDFLRRSSGTQSSSRCASSSWRRAGCGRLWTSAGRSSTTCGS